MSDKKIAHLLIDTSYLRAVGFNDPDFRLLLRHSQENAVKIFVSHIAWEELRTQYLENARGKVRRVKKEFEELKGLLPKNFILGGLPPPTLDIWTEAELDARSRDFMAQFSAENKIEIVPISSDHGDRAWQRYFATGLPSTQGEDRKKNRNDIPDLWIFEAACDKKEKYPELMALCGDERLSDALKTVGIRAFSKTQEVLEEIDQLLNVGVAAETVTVQDSATISIDDNAVVDVIEKENGLERALAKARKPFMDLDAKVLGYVAYLGTPTKDQLYNLIAQSGVPIEIVKNVAERLAFAEVITDTGNHYLVRNKEFSELAVRSVEPEIIKLLEEN